MGAMVTVECNKRKKVDECNRCNKFDRYNSFNKFSYGDTIKKI